MFRTLFTITVLMALLTFFTAPLHSGGPFRDVLFDNFCRELPYHEKAGCNGYLQYRIERGRNRDRALELCVWGCGEVMDDPTKVQDCQKGCQDANAQDH